MNEEVNLPEGLQLAVKLLAQIGDDESDRAIAAVHAAADERDELRAKYDELLVALHGIGAALGIQEGDRSPYSVTCGVLERVNRLAEIEAQEPVAVIRTWHKSGEQHAGMADWCDLVDALPDGEHKLYARPVTAIQDGEQLTCDVCGVVCRDPWHYSAGDRRHMHACDSCWPGVNTAPEAAR